MTAYDREEVARGFEQLLAGQYEKAIVALKKAQEILRVARRLGFSSYKYDAVEELEGVQATLRRGNMDVDWNKDRPETATETEYLALVESEKERKIIRKALEQTY